MQRSRACDGFTLMRSEWCMLVKHAWHRVNVSLSPKELMVFDCYTNDI